MALSPLVVAPNSRVQSQMTGKGFEFAVASELLLRGVICHMSTVDAGVDIMSWSREGTRIRIQVKGRNFSGHGSGVETVRFSTKSINDPSTKPEFVIVVMRFIEVTPSTSSYGALSYLILSWAVLDRLKRDGYLSPANDGKELRMQLNVEFDSRTGRATSVSLQKSYGRRREGRNVSNRLEAWDELIDAKGL